MMKKSAIVAAIAVLSISNSFAQEKPRKVKPNPTITSVNSVTSPNVVKKVLPSGVVMTEEVIVGPSMSQRSMNNNAGFSGLKVESDEEILAQAQKQKYMKGAVTHIGNTDNNIDYGPALEGYAKRLPLVEVLKQILPVGWKATASKAVNINKEVSWQGGKNWVATVEQLASDYTLNVLIDWENKTLKLLNEDGLIALNKSKEKIAKINFAKTEMVQVKNEKTGMVEGVKVSAEESAKVAHNAQAHGLPGFGTVGVWHVKEGNLRDNLQDLLDKLKVKLVYPDTVANYPIEDGYVLQGTLDGENGVLAQIAELYNVDNVKQALEFELKTGSTNKVLEVSNKTYQQRYFKENN